MTQGFGVIRMKTIFRAVCVCVCVNVSESLGKCAHIFLHCVLCLFLCAALVMLLFQALLSVLKVKTLPQGFCVHTGILRERIKHEGRTGKMMTNAVGFI